ncbi:hypothetical protein POX_a01089 [Penicillium oxalicum]|uniref:hypothetical protein n=1 Tax=Penicillium oxalicum TaxID=69781 RepID=UPI0020B6BBE5|nr:hypothetical protein POX_a01089 [Penicillium oxalicum]KAI2794490.1 hypothetical protein POX_a01089 [Penicillium oxalicum]
MLSSTPARQRTSISQSRPPPSARSRTTQNRTSAQVPEIPEYQPPESIISIEDQRQLRAILDRQYLEVAKRHIHDAGMQITYSAGEVSDRLRDAQTRYQRLKEKRRNLEQGQEVDTSNEDAAYQRLAEQEQKVGEIMDRLEERMRHMVDSDMKLVRMTEAVKEIDKEETQAQHVILGTRQMRSRQRAGRFHAASDDEDGEEQAEDPAREPTPVREVREKNAQNPPSQRLNASLAEGQRKWEELSLTQRYANNNDYTGFYRVVHDSKYPNDEAPPLPHSSTWFSHMEDPDSAAGGANGSSSTRRTRNQRQPSPANSDDIAIESEKISITCPITLVRFKDPVISKCKHNFEREAIMEMISRSRPLPGGRARVKAVKCPVCGTPLTADDLDFDRAMKRRVMRAEERDARRAGESDSENDDDADRPSKRNRITLASDAVDPEDAMDVDRPAGTQIKAEPGIVKRERGQTQQSDMSEEENEDEDEEEEEEEEEDEDEDGDEDESEETQDSE